MSGRGGAWIADEKEAQGSGIAEFSRGSRRCNPCFSESKGVDVASFSEIRDSSVFERVEKRANVESTYIEGSGSRSRVRLNVP